MIKRMVYAVTYFCTALITNIVLALSDFYVNKLDTTVYLKESFLPPAT